MEISWEDKRGNVRRGAVPENVLPFARLIGVDATADMLLLLGGAEVYFAKRPNGGLLEQAIGETATRALAAEMGGERMRLQVNPKFLARVLSGRGWSVARIARRLLRSDATVRDYLKDDRSNSKRATERPQSANLRRPQQ